MKCICEKFKCSNIRRYKTVSTGGYDLWCEIDSEGSRLIYSGFHNRDNIVYGKINLNELEEDGCPYVNELRVLKDLILL